MHKDDHARFVHHWKVVCKFPGEWFDVAWTAVARKYRREGFGDLIDTIEKELLDPERRGAPSMGWLALGVPANINVVEQGNRWVRKQIQEELHILEPSATLPTSLTALMDVLQVLWRTWTARPLERHRKPTGAQLKSIKMFQEALEEGHSNIIRMNGKAGADTCFVFKQVSKFGKLLKFTKKMALQTACDWSSGPPRTMSRKKLKNMGSIIFTTKDCCFPCWEWGTTGGCYHQDAVRAYLGVKPLTDPQERTGKIKKGRGRKRRARVTHFSHFSNAKGKKGNKKSK